ncbi:Esterase TesA [Aquicella siphonis]|uniref:Esterase TesA n=1 Tax=Aquicella siphonis TaxID=254247 RepID=A0A5E4PLF4_9COXI|nr:Esterase TesA [Aquicella siphonis]
MLAENTILILGDSLSSGYGIEPGKNWVALLKQRLTDRHYPYQVINASISGDTTSDGLSRLPGLLKQYHPAVTIIEMGGNDGLRGLQITVIKSNLLKLIQLAVQAKSQVLLLGVRMPPNYGHVYTQGFNDIFSGLAKDNSIHVIPEFLKGVDEDPNLMQPDGIHPNALAQAILLDNVWPVLVKLLGPPTRN